MDGDDFLQATLGATDLVYNLARRMVREHHAAEDLVQETYLAAYRAWAAGKRPDRVEAWMATICLNLGRSRFRRLSRRPDERLMEEPDARVAAGNDPAEEALSAVEAQRVRAGLWALPEEQRIAVTLVDLCGLTAKETARVMGTPRGTVLSRVHRGRKALAAVLRSEVPSREP